MKYVGEKSWRKVCYHAACVRVLPLAGLDFLPPERIRERGGAGYTQTVCSLCLYMDSKSNVCIWPRIPSWSTPHTTLSPPLPLAPRTTALKSSSHLCVRIISSWVPFGGSAHTFCSWKYGQPSRKLSTGAMRAYARAPFPYLP